MANHNIEIPEEEMPEEEIPEEEIPEEEIPESELDEIDDEVKKQREKNEEYKIWKQNSPYLYDLVITHALLWPSLTVEWLPDRDESSNKDYSVQKMILGTHIAGQEPDYLLLAQIQLPLEDDTNEDDQDFYGREESSYFNKLNIIQQINHDGEVNRARYMPQNPHIIATTTLSGDVYVFDYSKHPSKPLINNSCNPELKLKGLKEEENYSLSWNTMSHGHLLSGTEEKICLWDINVTPVDKALLAKQEVSLVNGTVMDVSWHHTHKDLFGSVDTKSFLNVWDIRSPSQGKPIHSVKAHELKVNSVSFNPFNEWVLATGSDDKTVKIFDMRKITIPVHTLNHHKEEVLEVQFSPQRETILASSCDGRLIMVWDLSRIGEEQAPEDEDDGPPELLFLHGGHTGMVSDISWNPCNDEVMASVADDNIVQI